MRVLCVQVVVYPLCSSVNCVFLCFRVLFASIEFLHAFVCSSSFFFFCFACCSRLQELLTSTSSSPLCVCRVRCSLHSLFLRCKPRGSSVFFRYEFAPSAQNHSARTMLSSTHLFHGLWFNLKGNPNTCYPPSQLS
ncbi:hypothetical protein PTSG_12686 [Salpingoeca rosetta]|uniref:Uncharacterized protein n=1 Tax=Salpingoeca rosetta (strain ATCC 50818 / BSB-021) TaxID=946362 RepID=F2UI47_SALR5|nr:uncharacterized protein PTSG_12686 [Salpingoeca rosetta]EGD76796.1 hypothetical protein PTSG_12686 [Salpingoeca rosetta]|eukprot:XP_004991168.1 hypothetical protein PTSG_12686 [Salpingoeca rosetta]